MAAPERFCVCHDKHMSQAQSILLVDDDPTFLEVMSRGMKRHGLSVEVATDGPSAKAIASQTQPEFILLDLNLPGESGLITLPDLLASCPNSRVVILTGYSSIATAVEAIKLGAFDYLCKPANLSQILAAFDGSPAVAPAEPAAAPLSVDRLEWEYIQQVLQQNDGNVTATAKALGMHRRTLQRKLRKRPVKH